MNRIEKLLIMTSVAVVAVVAVGSVCTDVDGENLNFERGSAGWKLPPAYSVRKGDGLNGTSFGSAAEKTGARTIKISLAPNEPALYRIK